MQLIRQSPAAIYHEVYDEILKCQSVNMILKCRHKMSNREKKVYYFLKKVYSFFHIFLILYIAVKLIACYKRTRSNKVPRKDEVDDIISFFYNAFKGEGARKLFSRFGRHHTGISIKRIQKWLNSTNPIFSNKPPLTPVIS